MGGAWVFEFSAALQREHQRALTPSSSHPPTENMTEKGSRSTEEGGVPIRGIITNVGGGERGLLAHSSTKP